jgi:hypothetical protein
MRPVSNAFRYSEVLMSEGDTNRMLAMRFSSKPSTIVNLKIKLMSNKKKEA